MKALFIGPKFYGYETQIIREFKKRDIEVEYFPERSDYLNSATHFLSKFNNDAKKLNSIYEKHLRKKLEGKKI